MTSAQEQQEECLVRPNWGFLFAQLLIKLSCVNKSIFYGRDYGTKGVLNKEH